MLDNIKHVEMLSENAFLKRQTDKTENTLTYDETDVI